MTFTFDEESHTYRLNGVVLPSVTRVLDPLVDFSGVHPDVLAKAGDYGTAVHKMSEFHLLGQLDEDELDEGLQGPLTALKKWCTDYPEIVAGITFIERAGYHPKLKYAGTPDLDGTAVIDIKSRKVNMLTDSIQTSAYDHMTGDGNRPHYVLELKQDGTYVFTLLNPTKAASALHWQRFRYLLDMHNMALEVSKWK